MNEKIIINANYLFDVYAFNDEINKPGFDIALAHYVVDHPMPAGMTVEDTEHFWTTNYDRLVAAFRQRDRKHFAEIVRQLVDRAAWSQA